LRSPEVCREGAANHSRGGCAPQLQRVRQTLVSEGGVRRAELPAKLNPAKAPEGWNTPRRVALFQSHRAARSVLDCGSPLPLFPPDQRAHDERHDSWPRHSPAPCGVPVRRWFWNAACGIAGHATKS